MKSRKQRQRQSRRSAKRQEAGMRSAPAQLPPVMPAAASRRTAGMRIAAQLGSRPTAAAAIPLPAPATIAMSAATTVDAPIASPLPVEVAVETVSALPIHPPPKAPVADQPTAERAADAPVPDPVPVRDSVPVPEPMPVPDPVPVTVQSEAEALLLAEITAPPARPLAGTSAGDSGRGAPLPRHLAPARVETGWLARIGRRLRAPLSGRPAPRVADEVRQLRDDIAALKDAMDVLLTRTAAD
jgi:hypothetical protein